MSKDPKSKIRANDVYRSLCRVLTEFGVGRHDVVDMRPHPKIVFDFCGETIQFSFAGTPGSQGAARVSTAKLRRLLRVKQYAAMGSAAPGEGEDNRPQASEALVRIVEFRRAHIETVDVGGRPHVALRPIVEGMGLDWPSQYSRIKRDAVLSTCIVLTTMQVGGQRRETSVLPLNLLNGFLFGIDAGRVRDEIRDEVIAYQRECFDALSAYWTEGVAVRGPSGLIVLDEDTRRAIGGICKSVIKAQLEELRATSELALEGVARLEHRVLTSPLAPTFDLAGTVSASEIIEMAGIAGSERQRGTTQTITSNLLDFCSGLGCRRTPADLNPSRPWRFPRDEARRWLFGETLGAEIIRNQIAAQKKKKAAGKGAQTALRLVPVEERP